MSTCCPVSWSLIQPQFHSRLKSSSVPLIGQDDAFLLYLIILTLYEEGVKPTALEIHSKVRETNSSPELLRWSLAYYLLLPELYQVHVAGVQIKPTQESLCHDVLNVVNAASGAGIGLRPEVCVYFQKSPSWWRGWVDVKSPTNIYPPIVWLDLLNYLHEATSDSGIQQAISNGIMCAQTRYALAKAFKKHGPQRIRRLRLGDIAHLIQLAILNGFLCYEAATIQPTWTSYTVIKGKSYELRWDLFDEVDAQIKMYNDCTSHVQWALEAGACVQSKESSSLSDRSTTAASGASTLTHVSSIEQLRACLRVMLDETPRLLLSQIRVILKNQFQLTLRPSDFGHMKLSDLLVARASDFCTLTRIRNRHVYIEKKVELQRGGAGSEMCTSEFGTATPLQEKAPPGALYTCAVIISAFFSGIAEGHNALWTIGDAMALKYFAKSHFDILKQPNPNWDVRDVQRINDIFNQIKQTFFKSSM